MRRTGLIALTAIIVLAGLVGIALLVQSRDDAGITPAGGPGQAAPEQTSRTLRQGNVIITFADPADEDAVRTVAEEIGGPPDQALVHAGQAVMVRRDAGGSGIEALAFKRRLRASGTDDPKLRAFVEHFLGRGDGSADG